MSCASAPAGAKNAFCTDDHRIKSMKAPDGTDVLFPEEPHDMILDDQLGVLYVGHLGTVQSGVRLPRGVSVVDVGVEGGPGACSAATRTPTLASILNIAFPNSIALGVRSLTVEHQGDAAGTLLATSENTTEIAELIFEHPDRVPCQVDPQNPAIAARRDLTLDAGRSFSSSAFGTHGGDLRGIELTGGGDRAYVLHHQYAAGGEYNPPSVVAIDRAPGANGQPTDEPLGTVTVCNGPNRLLQHDAGRGVRLFVNCFDNGQIYVVEPESLNIESIIEMGAGPTELVFPPEPNDQTVAYVANFPNNNLSVVDLKPGSPTEYHVVQRIGFARPTAIPQ
jgi:hypothetical protein